jgi:hypothetical protein
MLLYVISTFVIQSKLIHIISVPPPIISAIRLNRFSSIGCGVAFPEGSFGDI